MTKQIPIVFSIVILIALVVSFFYFVSMGAPIEAFGIAITLAIGGIALVISFHALFSSEESNKIAKTANTIADNNAKRQIANSIRPNVTFDMKIRNVDDEVISNLGATEKDYYIKIKDTYNNKLTKQIYYNHGYGMAHNWITDYKFYKKGSGFSDEGYSKVLKKHTSNIAVGGDGNKYFDTINFKNDIFETYDYCIARIKFKDADKNEFCQCKMYWNKKPKREHLDLESFQRTNIYILSLSINKDKKTKCNGCFFDNFKKNVFAFKSAILIQSLIQSS